MNERREFPPEALRQYALLADGERGALCGPHGELVWLCAPRWHDPAVFSTLLGGSGAYAVTPAGRCVWGGTYEPGTLIWRNFWSVDVERALECRDALARPASTTGLIVLRRITATRGSARVNVVLDACAQFGTEPMRELHRSEDGVWTARTGELSMRWAGAPEAQPDERGRLAASLYLEEGEQRELVFELARGRLPAQRPRAEELWQRTERAWSEEVPSFENSAAPRDTRHAYAVLAGLTSVDGGMVAAATTSLPERASAGENYDYRYAWIRDQAYAGIAVGAAGPLGLLESAARTVTDRLLAHGDQLSPAYTVDGHDVPGQAELDLDGYPGASAICGNRVNGQFQLDAFGDALLLFATAARHDLLGPEGWHAAQIAADAIATRWDDRDAGVWELEPQWWTHSRLECAAGLRAFAAVTHGVTPGQQGGADLEALADHLVDECRRRAVSPNGSWRRHPGDDRVDAALLLPTIRGAIDPRDPQAKATLAAVNRDLTMDGYTFRFAPEDGELGAAEGAFLMCGFVRALAEQQQGDPVAAWRSFERNRAACGPPGLMAEEFDVSQRQLRGNLPQAFVHALLFEASVRLGDGADGAGLSSRQV